MPKQEKGKAAPLPVTGKRTPLLKREKPVFWKPKMAGEHLTGKLLRIVRGSQYGPSLRIATSEGIKSVSVNVILADVDWTLVVGKVLDFTFKGLVGKRGARDYEVDLIETEEAPF